MSGPGTGHPPPRLSVVIPTYQRRAVLERTLPTILGQDPPPGGFEVIVVIDGSTDGTQRMLAERFPDPRLKAIATANAGPAVARNVGIEAATGAIVLLLDDDMICPAGLLLAHAAAHDAGPMRAAFGPIVGIAGDSAPAEFTRRALDDYYRRMRDEWDPATLPTAYAAPNTSVGRETLRAAGGFDPRFARAHEDADLGLRLRAMGVQYVYLPDAPVSQLYAKDAVDLVVHDAEHHGAGEVLLCEVHPSLRRHSFLRSLAGGSPIRRFVRATIARLPFPPDLLLRPWSELLELLPSGWLLAARLRLLELRGYATRLRAARRAAGGWRPLHDRFGRRCPALLYHHVGPPRPGLPPALTVSPERFESQMRFLKRCGFEAITASRWADWVERGAALPARPFVLTFDDGYAELAEHAFPTLRRLGFGATVFLVTGRIGGSNDWDAELGIARLPLLDRDRIAAWARDGIEFGSHGRSHRRLDALTETEVREELEHGSSELAVLTGAPPRALAYPFGVVTAAAVAAAAPFSLAYGCEDGINTLATAPHEQRRTMVQPSDTRVDVALRAWLGWSPLSRLRARARLRSRLGSLRPPARR